MYSAAPVWVIFEIWICVCVSGLVHLLPVSKFSLCQSASTVTKSLTVTVQSRKCKLPSEKETQAPGSSQPEQARESCSDSMAQQILQFCNCSRTQEAIGSGPRFQILSHVFACCTSQKTHWHARIARETFACKFCVQFSYIRVYSDFLNVQKRVTQIIYLGPLPKKQCMLPSKSIDLQQCHLPLFPSDPVRPLY